ncbi:MAG: hypothetical protein ACRDIE_09995, partial [Chloroflexota bacterium]
MRSVAMRLLCVLGISLSLPVPTSAGSVAAAAVAPLPLAGLPALSALPAAQVRQLAATPTDHVIVVLRDQSPAGAARSAARSAILQDLARVGARAVHPSQVINAIGATVSPAEAVRLRSDRAVLSVAPDLIIHMAQPTPVQ